MSWHNVGLNVDSKRMIAHLQVVRGTDSGAGMAGMLSNQLKGLHARTWTEPLETLPCIADDHDATPSGNQ